MDHYPEKSATKKVVLAVEDEPSVLDALVFLLESEGYRVLAAPDGHDALALAQVERPDIVVTDFRMPVMSGQMLAVEMSEKLDLSTIPIILVSGAQTFEAQKTRHLFDVILQKPYDANMLLSHIERLIAHAASAPAMS